MSVSILCPTRGRPDNMRRLVESAEATAVGIPQFVFYVDDDDLASVGQLGNLRDEGYDVDALVGERIVLSEMWNRCARRAKYDIMMHCGDDIIFRSDAWDKHVHAAFNDYDDKLILVHGRDGYQDRNLATHSFLHRTWVDVLGYFVPPYFSSDYNDTWLTEVADAVGRRVYLEHVYTEHMHPVVGKGPLDLTHQERLERHARDNVGQLYADLAPRRAEDVRKLRDAINTFGGTYAVER